MSPARGSLRRRPRGTRTDSGGLVEMNPVVKKETLYKKWVAIDYGLYQAATTFVTGGGELTAGLKPEDWMITRHYPDNRQPGWY